MHQDLKQPGRELDALVAERVMGWQKDNREDPNWRPYWRKSPCGTNELVDLNNFRFSTDIAAAWEVVDKLAPERRQDFKLVYARREWRAVFTTGKGVREGISDTAPHAICLAALRACGVNGGEGP